MRRSSLLFFWAGKGGQLDANEHPERGWVKSAWLEVSATSFFPLETPHDQQ